MRIDGADERHVGGVEPDDAMVAFVDVAVPAHRRGEDEVAFFHFTASTIDDGGGAVGAGGKTYRRSGVAVRAGAVARLQHGEGGEQRGGGRGFRAEGRMRHDQRAALDVDRDLADRAVQERLDVAPAPDERRVLGGRLDRRDALVAVPERMQVRGFELGDEGVGLLLQRLRPQPSSASFPVPSCAGSHRPRPTLPAATIQRLHAKSIS